MNFILGSLLFITISSAIPTKEKNGDTKTNVDNQKLDDDRIGLNLNRGHAYAVGPNGGYSGSDANTYGIHAGIRHPGNYYTPLFSQTGGQGSSYSSGPDAPTTWANGNTQLGNGYTGGNSGAGFHGGQGIAQTDSYTQHIEIPLDPFGTVLYSNLKDKKHKPERTEN